VTTKLTRTSESIPKRQWTNNKGPFIYDDHTEEGAEGQAQVDAFERG